MTELAELFQGVERGELPADDGKVRTLRQPADGRAAVIAFTAHNVVAADVDPDWVSQRVPPDDLSAPLNPPFLTALCERLGRRVNCVDMVTYAPAEPAPHDEPELELTELTDNDHPRVRRALNYRSDVRVWSTEGGVLVLGRGLGSRLEVAFEVDPDHRGNGLGRALARAARALASCYGAAGVWAQVSPGNAASVRTLLAAGYQPIGSEALLVRHRTAGG